jgi:6-phosphogluconolactonase (cycloisomerase 2 family)
VSFRVDQQTGMLSHEGPSVRTGSPVCIVFAATAQVRASGLRGR